MSVFDGVATAVHAVKCCADMRDAVLLLGSSPAYDSAISYQQVLHAVNLMMVFSLLYAGI